MKTVIKGVVGMAALLTAGCATITNDAHQQVHFVAPGCKGKEVSCFAQNKRGSWEFKPPAYVMIRRSDDVLQLHCKNDEDVDHRQSIPSRMGGKIVASAVFLDLGIVDSITDKHREYPAQVVLTACVTE